MIREFKISIDESQLTDLKFRLANTRWPSKLRDVGWIMGMDVSFLQSLTEYWLEEFDWRRVELALNEIPQFEAVTDDGTIHFVHLKSRAPWALPIVLTHGWPSTFVDLIKLGQMLAYPALYGRALEDSFDVVIPSLPGYAFSSTPSELGTNVFTIADQWAALMDGLGYERFLAHGGDIGAGVTTALGLHYPQRVYGLHLNFIPGSFQPHIRDGDELSPEEVSFFAARQVWLDEQGGYSHVQATKPDVLAPALNDSPVGLAAWLVDKFRSWSDCDGDVWRRFTKEELLTTVCLYWFTRTLPSSIRIYWEGRKQPLRFAEDERVDVPVSVAHFPKEIYFPPKRYVERGYHVEQWTEMPRGGHFAAMEEPELLANDIRSFARNFR